MQKLAAVVILVCAISFASWAVEPPADAEKYWGQWRGPSATGVSPDGDPPVEWSETKNVRWKIEIPGNGYGTPVVWGDRIFLLTAVPAGETIVASLLTEPPEGADEEFEDVWRTMGSGPKGRPAGRN